MASLQSLSYPCLLLASVLAIASADHQNFELLLNVSLLPQSNEVTLLCHYHSNLTKQAIREHREANVITFSLNGSVCSDHHLSNYKEWDFESGAVAEFKVPKSEMFIGTFACETLTERSQTSQLIFLSPESKELVVYVLAAVVAVLAIGLLLMLLICSVMCYFMAKAKGIHKSEKGYLYDAPIKRVSSKKAISTRHQSTVENVSYCNLLSVGPKHFTDLKTGQLAPYFLQPELKLFTYIDPPEHVTFDWSGGRYINTDHEIELHIPEHAIPTGKTITVRVAVSATSPLPVPHNSKPVSPIVHFCVVEDPNFKFEKPVKIVIPHYLSVPSTDSVDSMGLQFAKAAHNQASFQNCDGKASFEAGKSYGTLLTDHFCHFCITCGVTSISEANSCYRLIRIIPRRPSATWEAQFCITYFLRSCLRSIEKCYNARDYEVTSLRRFTFSDSLETASLQIHFGRRILGGWNLAQSGSSSKVYAKDVDFLGMGEDILAQMEEEGLYPPRFVIRVNGSCATEAVTTSVHFSGAREDLQTELVLEPLQQYLGVRQPWYEPFDNRPITRSSTFSGPLSAGRRDVPLPSRSLHSLTNPNRPTHAFLMNHIAAAIPSKWHAIGVQLNLSNGQLDQIEQDHSTVNRRFSEVFSLWEKQPPGALPYEWASLFEALHSPQVLEIKLANDVELLVSATASNARKNGLGTRPIQRV